MTEHESGAARGTALTRRLMALWDAPPADPAAANAAFAELYTDPVMINGAAVSISDLVSMAHGLSGVYADARQEVTDVVEGADGVTVAFTLSGRHVGPLPTALGVVPPTGRQVAVRVIDLLAVRDGLITAVTVISDDLGMLRQRGVVGLADEQAETHRMPRAGRGIGTAPTGTVGYR